MPWRLIVSIVLFAVFLTFITFNLDNRCDLSIGFVKFEQVPVFMTVFVCFVLGLVCGMTFILFTKGKRGEKRKKEFASNNEASPRDNESIADKRKKFMRGHGGSSNEKA